MKFPQAFVFFNRNYTVTLAQIQSLYGPEIKIDFFLSDHDGYSAIERRLMLARKISQTCTEKYLSLGPCAVIQTDQLNSFFLLKFSSEIVDVVWYSNSQDFIKLRGSIAVMKNYWNFYSGMYTAVFHYNRAEKVLGQDCPVFTRNHHLMGKLKKHMDSLDSRAIFQSMSDRVKRIAHVGKHQI
jgi:hypothetical protein